MKLCKEDILALEQKHRALFINSLSGFKSANLVGTANSDKQSNLAIVSSVVHLGANPALVAMVMRPHTVPRGTLENILSTGFYTLNHVNSDIYQQAHQTSARYDDDISEFNEVGLTEQWEDDFIAPFVKESRIKIGVKFRERKTLDINGTEFIIGEIVSIEMPDNIVSEDGFVSLEKAGSVAVSSLDTYHSTQTLASLSYAKPNKKVTELERKVSQTMSVFEQTERKQTQPNCVLVVAATGGIGHAYCDNLLQQYPDVHLIRMAREPNKLGPLNGNITDIALDLNDDESISTAISALKDQPSIDQVFIASGWLHDEHTKPEKTHRSLDRQHLLKAYEINAIGPALFISKLISTLDSQHAMKIGVLSARVGSVSDNRLGGWHSYRSSKSALHMLIKNIAIECKQSKKMISIVGLQPGTTDTALSAPFQKGVSPENLQSPDYTAKQLIKVMNLIDVNDSGGLFDFLGHSFEP